MRRNMVQNNNTLELGCYIDGAIPRTNNERILVLTNMLEQVAPQHSLVFEVREILNLTPKRTLDDAYYAHELLIELERALKLKLVRIHSC